jgi:hypothetical protein
MKKIDEASVTTLDRSVSSEFGNTRKEKSGTIQITSMIAIPYESSQGLEFKFTVRSNSKEYDTVLMFDNVLGEGSKQAEMKPDLLNTVLTPDENEFRFITLSKIANNIKVHCTCLDFHYRFATWNHRDKSLHGDPPTPYVQTTDRQPVNPNKVPGLCKHVMASIQKLVEEKYLV